MQKVHLSLGTENTRPAVSDRRLDTSSAFRDMLKDVNGEREGVQSRGNEMQPILVGTISEDKPTVSELLMEHDQLKTSTWDILSSEENRSREYRRLQTGTEIYYDPKKNTLSWSSASETDGIPVLQSDRVSHVPAGDESLRESRVLGVISKEYPTVSHLLKADELLGSETWNILAEKVNSSKEFNTLATGTEVMYNPQTKEISWQPPERTVHSTNVLPASFPATDGSGFAASSSSQVIPGPSPLQEYRRLTENRAIATSEEQPILLGTIDKNTTTVSHLLTADPRFREDAWQLLNNTLNITKPFHRIPVGTEVYIQPGSGEIFWNSEEVVRQPIAHIAATARKHRYVEEDSIPGMLPAPDLSEAVKPFMGRAYEDIDCYELLVEGLRRMDIRYDGKDGLLTRLMSMAREQGLPSNAYLNGEGIVKVAGSLVFSKSIPAVADWRTTADDLIRELEPLLNKGQILSFSTENRGHTGIVSQLNNQWTFINSGRLDNVLTENSPASGVGEEVLEEEIRNWFRVAQTNGESLMVTLGQLEQVRTVTAYNETPSGSAARILKNPG